MNKQNKKDAGYKISPPRLPEEERLIGPQFLTLRNFQNIMQTSSPEVIEHLFKEAGVQVPEELLKDMEKVKGYANQFKELDEDWRTMRDQLNGETMRLWVRLQKMGFSPEIIKATLHKEYLVLNGDRYTAYVLGMIEH